MNQEELCHKLIEGAVSVIAQEGLDKATTKRIGLKTHTNEAYIYRCFQGKEDLFAKMFDFLDDELTEIVMQHIEVMYMADLEYEVRCRLFFSTVWAFLLGSRDKCLAYVRYYYSPYFERYSVEDHKRRFLPVIAKFKDAFVEEADVWMILNHILNVMLDFAIKVHNGQMPEKDNYSEHVFRVIYRSVEQYFKKGE